jgi:hypothetical protein
LTGTAAGGSIGSRERGSTTEAVIVCSEQRRNEAVPRHLLPNRYGWQAAADRGARHLDFKCIEWDQHEQRIGKLSLKPSRQMLFGSHWDVAVVCPASSHRGNQRRQQYRTKDVTVRRSFTHHRIGSLRPGRLATSDVNRP